MFEAEHKRCINGGPVAEAMVRVCHLSEYQRLCVSLEVLHMILSSFCFLAVSIPPSFVFDPQHESFQLATLLSPFRI